MPTFYPGQTDYIEKLNTLALASELADIEANTAAVAASAAAAAASATSASTSASTATTKAGEASTSASNAAASATSASTSASTATTKAGEASTSASNAATSATNAATSATAASTTFNNFRSVYYGSLASNPTLDPLGAAISLGDLYYNTTAPELRVYNGTSWVSAYLPVASYELIANKGAASGYAPLDAASKIATTYLSLYDAYTTTLTNKTLTNPVINGFTGDTSTINIGSGQIVKDTAGNVGLGVSSPLRRLHVVSGQSTVPDLAIQGASTTQGWLGFGTGNDYGIQGGSDYLGIKFRVQGAVAGQFDTSGNLGVGVTPTSGVKLSVDGGARITGVYASLYNSTAALLGNATYNPKLSLYSSSGYTWSTRNNDVGGAGEWVLRYEEGSLDAVKVSRSGNVAHAGYTNLGTGYTSANDYHPAIKTKVLKGTTASSQGATASIAHGVTQTKVISIVVGVDSTGTGNFLPPGLTAAVYDAGYEYQWVSGSGSIYLFNASGNSANILSKAYTVTITYEE